MSSAISKHVKISIKGKEDNPVYNDNLFAAEIVYSNINTSSGNKTISIINKDKSTNTFTGNYSNIQLRFDNSLDYIYTKTDTSSSDYSKLSDGNYSEISIGEQQSNLDKTIQINQNNDPNNWQTKYQGNKQIGQILIDGEAEPTKTGQIDSNGVLELYPTLQGGSTFFMNMGLDDPTKDPCFSYDGMNKGVPTQKKTENGVTFYNTPGSKVNYHSGSPSGRIIRLGIYAEPGSKGQAQKHTWKEKPDFIWGQKGIRNHELTGFIRMHGDLGVHKSLACKVCGGNLDAGRSLVETCYPISSKDTVRANVNYEHFPYVKVSGVKQFFSGDYCQDNKWVGIKHVHIVADDKSHATNYLYVDTDPFDSSGKPNNNWKLKAEWTDNGVPGYQNIPATWRSQVDKIRVDGWQNVDFTLMSIREIDPHSKPSIIVSAEQHKEGRIIDDSEITIDHNLFEEENSEVPVDN